MCNYCYTRFNKSITWCIFTCIREISIYNILHFIFYGELQPINSFVVKLSDDKCTANKCVILDTYVMLSNYLINLK